MTSTKFTVEFCIWLEIETDFNVLLYSFPFIAMTYVVIYNYKDASLELGGSTQQRCILLWWTT